jgi:hypothetical protein
MLATVGATAMLLAACGGSASKPAVATVPVSALTRAAYVSTAAPGYKVLLRIQQTIGSAQVTTTGSGTFSPATRSGAITMHVAVPGLASALLGNGVNLRVVTSGATFYMKMPAAIASKIRGAKPWWKLNLAALARADGIPGISSLTSGTSSLNDPGEYLDYLRAASAGSVKDLGQATVHGTQTTHYRANVTLSKLPDAVPAASRAGVTQLVKALQARLGLQSMPIDAWIDAQHRVRQVELSYTVKVPTTGQTSRISTLVDFVAYGHQPAPAIPPPSQTTNFNSLLSKLGQP